MCGSTFLSFLKNRKDNNLPMRTIVIVSRNICTQCSLVMSNRILSCKSRPYCRIENNETIGNLADVYICLRDVCNVKYKNYVNDYINNYIDDVKPITL